jgi:hypothetical protein
MSSSLTFRLLTNCRPFTMRGIGFLEGHKELNAGVKFDAFKGNTARGFRSKMDQWLDGANGPGTSFHTFKNPAHRHCFAFKHHEHRLYGFLCHPRDNDARFMLCALCIYATKHEHESDTAELDRVEQWYSNTGARKAIELIYPPTKKQSGGGMWKQ